MKNSQGFTLIELLITVVIAAVVLALGVPSFRTMIQDNRIAVQTNDFISSLNLARSEAVKRGTRITMCRSADRSACGGGGVNWEDGWIVFEDRAGPGVRDTATEELIRVHDGLNAGTMLRGDTNVADRVSFNSKGFSFGFGGQLILCDERGFGDPARVLIMSNTGRARTVKATANDDDAPLTTCTP